MNKRWNIVLTSRKGVLALRDLWDGNGSGRVIEYMGLLRRSGKPGRVTSAIPIRDPTISRRGVVTDADGIVGASDDCY